MSYVKSYDLENLTIATMASHTALQILRAAKRESFRTIAIATITKSEFYKKIHFIDKVVTVQSNEVEKLEPELIRENTIFIPHGSFVEYCGPVKARNFKVPFFGTRGLIEIESVQSLKMKLLRTAGLPTPLEYDSAEEAVPPVIVKFEGAKGGRGYFVATDRKNLMTRLKNIKEKYFIQQYLIGVPAYIHYFASPLMKRVELFGSDVRYESNVDGRVLGLSEPSFTVVGNRPVVLRESLLPKLAEYGEAFVKGVEEMTGQKMIGPFCLETVIDDMMEMRVFEFSGRIVAGTNVYMGVGSPYSTLYFDRVMDMGERIALEIKEAARKGVLEDVTT